MVELVTLPSSKSIFETTLDFIYFIIPVAISIYAIRYVRKSRFFYIEQDNIKLYDDIAKNITDLSISYKSENINDNLIFCKGTIIFKSHTDIKRDDIDTELTIYSPENNSRWKHFEITKTSDGYHPKFIIDNNKVIIDKSMLKIDDYISFAGLLDSKNTKILISHRIFNITPKSINLKEANVRAYRTLAIYLSILFFITLGVYTYDKYREKGREKEFNLQINKIKQLKQHWSDYTATYLNNGRKIDIIKLSKIYEKNINNKNLEIKTKNEKKDDSLSNVYFQNKTDKNKINALEAIIKTLTERYSYSKNPYEIIQDESHETLNNLLKTNQLIENKVYKINDTIQVKYKNSDYKYFETKDKMQSEKSIDYFGYLSSLIFYIFSLIIVFLMIACWYLYITLIKLIKVYQN
ncbi:hypothetical protein MC916_002605 [Elizabethkingia anophelis]|uniref:hypothetical protein n=1 Tax=Elizabethkingia anophelis TaxID=1117645 RepID=UPI001D6AEE7B|nr:hypothetical protein [Elizabethkingia anophelis]EHM7982735.1 hypothetical protein [Elizabethkingia anophelis]EHM8032430.1 hypothetical protein [Elizabethkingia anophelis]EHZ9535400.1 hypothetical protein [Elizabethkingia anophelis]EKU3673310.1 hypothetical protein [Elizabethkingia anophelis]EKU4210289.1 hypothetical protein [Elizabethkingia anophelis]